MDFIEIAMVDIDGEAAESVSELFNRYGHGGAVVEATPPHFDKITVRTVVPGEDDQRRRHIEMMLALIGKALPHGLPEPRFQFVGQSEWADSWKEHFHVIRVGRRFVIKPSWREYVPAAEDIVIEIDPGLAFGSGLHPTTQLCLKIFEDMSWQGQSLFDVGTGSGILSITARKLGAGPIRAVDVDEVAVAAAQENFRRNGLYPLPNPPSRVGQEAAVEIAVGSAADAGGQCWQVVVANILAHILIELMPDLAAALAPGAQLILSGMIGEQEDEVAAAVEGQELQVVERRMAEDWVALVVERRSTR